MPLSVGAATVSIVPDRVLQGDPVMIMVSGTSTAGIRSGTAAGSKLYFFDYAGGPKAFYGVDINQKTGTTSVAVIFKDGSRATASFIVGSRLRPVESMPIPAQLGGNSAANQARIVSILGTENAELAAIYSRTDKALWRGAGTSTFVFPIASTTGESRVVTDPYGYNRDSGANTITHKGVDFHAPPGTPVYAVNRGIVRSARKYVVYGNSVIVDHGLGLLSMYMHLSKMVVSPGQLAEKGQLIGYSGETGYSEGPHLHLTIRIGGVSVDPIQFFALFGEK
jgi:murein DD-endopeptidase MepM/ murein hydrolase activator NlpD